MSANKFSELAAEVTSDPARALNVEREKVVALTEQWQYAEAQLTEARWLVRHACPFVAPTDPEYTKWWSRQRVFLSGRRDDT